MRFLPSFETIKSASKKIASWTNSAASYLYSFLDGATIPTLIPIIIRFWFDGLKPNNEKGLPILKDSPASVKALLAIMGFSGLLNVVLRKIYLPRKEKELAILKDNQTELNAILIEGGDYKSRLEKENAIWESVNFIKDGVDIHALQNFAEKRDLNLNIRYVDTSEQLREMLQTLEKIKKTTVNTHKLIVKSRKEWVPTFLLSLFSAIGGFGIPVVLALTVGALVQDFHLLSFGQELMISIVSLGVFSSITNGVLTFRTLNQQKNEYLVIMKEIQQRQEMAFGLLKDSQSLLIKNKDLRTQIQNKLSIANVEEMIFPYEFKLFKPLQQNQLGTSRITISRYNVQDENTRPLLLADDATNYLSITLS